MEAVKKSLLNALKVLLLPIVLFFLFVILSGGKFGSPISIKVVLIQAVIPILIGWGISFNLIVGAWDFSAGATIALAAMIAADLSGSFGLVGLILGCLVISFLLEAITGLVFTFLRIPSIITTIGMMLIYEAATTIYKNGGPISVKHGASVLGQPPYIFILCIVIGIIYYVVYNHTVFGSNIRAMGNGSLVAKNVGINPRKVKLQAFLVAGFFVGVAAIAYLSYGGTAAAKYNMATMSMTFQPIMGMIIALSLQRYINITLGVVIGEVSIKIISAGLVSMGLTSSLQQIITGLALLCVLIATSINLKLSERSEKAARMQGID
ncbi:MAG: hypothetical protein K0S04_1777 [Herbinix sp.]|jgi:ribose transport system permease protein|nr:hypothetical protein [Herbinix sp.]